MPPPWDFELIAACLDPTEVVGQGTYERWILTSTVAESRL